MTSCAVSTSGSHTSESDPGSVAVMWDASFSYADVDRTRELKLLRTLLKGTKKVDLVVFRNVAGNQNVLNDISSP